MDAGGRTREVNMAIDHEVEALTNRTSWREVRIFLGLAFGLAWLLDLALFLSTGYGNNVQTLLLLQAQMLTPALAAVVVLMFIDRRSPIHFKTYRDRPRWFFWFFLLFGSVYMTLGLGSIAFPDQGAVLSAVGSMLAVFGLLVLIAVRGFSSSEAFEKAGLEGGRLRDWFRYGLGFVLFYALQLLLNMVFDLGQQVDLNQLVQELAPEGGSPGISPNLFLLLGGFQTILIGPLIGLLFGFGEEYGWRSFLQERITRLGKVRGLVLLGLIWGVWHYPVILMGHNYPGRPLWGVILMTGYTLALSFVLGYVMLKTRSVWLVAFLHALNNQTLAFFNAVIYQPNDPVFSFGTGLFGLLTFIPVVLLLLRDPVWSDNQGGPEKPESELSPSSGMWG